jgi:predicted DsbA family dithiol-disulfide isomerase
LAEPALRELVKLEPEVEVVWRTFELRPDPVPTLDPKGDYLKNAWQNSVYPLAEGLGVKMVLPPLQPRSRLAHEAAHWAQSQGHFDEYHAEIFRAFFERGEDIGNIEVLISLALELGLDSGSLRTALETHAFLLSVLSDEREAGALGINGVPAFVAERKSALTGVQPVENLRRLVRSTMSRSAER